MSGGYLTCKRIFNKSETNPSAVYTIFAHVDDKNTKHIKQEDALFFPGQKISAPFVYWLVLNVCSAIKRHQAMTVC